MVWLGDYGLLQTVLAAVGLVAGAIGWFVAWRARRRQRGLAWRVHLTPLMRFGPGLDPALHVQYASQPVTDLTLLRVQLANIGTEPIRPEDFAEPATIHLTDGRTALRVWIDDESDSLGARLTTPAPNTIQLAPVLLNPGDTVPILALLDARPAAPITMRVRVAGVRALTPEPRFAAPRGLWTVLVLMLIGAATPAILFRVILESGQIDPALRTPFFLAILFGYLTQIALAAWMLWQVRQLQNRLTRL